jgi:hypothetical protein
MIKPAHRLADGGYRRHVQRRRPSQQDNRYSQRARRSDLAIGRPAAAVLRHDHLNGVRGEKPAFLLFGEGSAIENIVSVRDGERRIYRINAANDVVVLGRRGEMRDFLAADREKHFSGLPSQRTRSLQHVSDLCPLIAGNRRPRWPAQGNQRCNGLLGRVQRMGRHRRCIRMGGVDQSADPMGAQVFNEAGCSAKPPRSSGHSLSQRRGRATGQRQSDRHVGTGGELLAQQSRLRGAAKNEDVLFHVAR